MVRLIAKMIPILKWTIITLIVCVIVIGIWVWRVYGKEIQLVQALSQDTETTYLVLFQNTLELRPTGGFVGNFAELTLKKGRVKNYTIYNTNAFDFGKPGIDSPQPFKDMLGVQQIQMRDGNWSPHFPATAEQMISLYTLQGGEKEINGVIAVNALLLPEVLRIMGPVRVDGIDEELTPENVLLTIQYELNFGFIDRGVDRRDRKEPIRDLAAELESRISNTSPINLYRLATMMVDQADKKQILMWSKDDTIQKRIDNLGWNGVIDTDTVGDYFMLVDANLGALKTDYYMERDIKKTVDECGDKLCSKISIMYRNTAKTASELNNDYKSYSRIIVPKDAFITNITGIESRPTPIDYSTAYNKKFAGFEINVPFNGQREVIIEYTMPKLKEYTLDIQKQPGIVGYDFELDYRPGNKKENVFIDSDWSWKE